MPSPTVVSHEGPVNREFICEVVRRKFARSYLEIGVRDGSTLNMIECNAIGVDPDFAIREFRMDGKKELHLYRMTSDTFFRDHDPRHILRSPLDVAYLDGLHQFEYLLRDFINSERVSHPNAVIILDDCLPANLEMTERVHNVEARADQNLAGWWTGDVWKILPILKKYRPDLRITPVSTIPTGSVCITNLDPTSQVLLTHYSSILSDFLPRQLKDLNSFYATYPPVSAQVLLHAFDASLYVGP